MNNEMTAEQIAQSYKSAMDSVNLINAGKPEGESDSDWEKTIKRNADHLEIMLAKDYWTDEDLEPFRKAVAESAKPANNK